jgi:hypothetical protein
VTDTTSVDQWLQDTLEGDATIQATFATYEQPVQVYDTLAPAGIAYPWVLFDLGSTLDTNGIGPNARVLTVNTYRVRAVARVNTYRAPVLTALADAIEAALQSAAADAVLGVRRESEYRFTESADGRQIRHLGGNYTIWAKAL